MAKYVFAPEEMSWGEHHYRAMAMRGQIASIRTAEENEQITTIAAGKTVWIGGMRKGGGNGPGANHWYWSDGRPWAYTNWHHGEPNNYGGGENRVCLGMQARGTWNDINEWWAGPAVYELPANMGIDILEAVTGKPVSFRITDAPTSNDAWVGIYPESAPDNEHGGEGDRWNWLNKIDPNNATFPEKSEGRWSIRVFSDGGFSLDSRLDFDITPKKENWWKD